MPDLSQLPKYLLVYGTRDHRVAYSDSFVRNSLRGRYTRYGDRGLDGAAVLTLPGYEDVTKRFIIGEECEPAPF